MNGATLLGLFATWIGWAGSFLVLYALQATGCRAGWDGQTIGSISVLRLLLVATAACIVLILVGLSWKVTHSRLEPSLTRISVLANGAAILATLCFAGVLWLRMCP